MCENFKLHLKQKIKYKDLLKTRGGSCRARIKCIENETYTINSHDLFQNYVCDIVFY